MPPKAASHAAKDKDKGASTVKENKRIANRLAQRKFRRQRKDYVDHLEKELVLCRAGANEELIQRRKEIEVIKAQRDELKDLLDHVVNTLSRVCGTGPESIGVAPSPDNILQSNNRTHHLPEELPHAVDASHLTPKEIEGEIHVALSTIASDAGHSHDLEPGASTFNADETLADPVGENVSLGSVANKDTADDGSKDGHVPALNTSASLNDEDSASYASQAPNSFQLFSPEFVDQDTYVGGHFASGQAIPDINVTDTAQATSNPIRASEDSMQLSNIYHDPTLDLDRVPWGGSPQVNSVSREISSQEGRTASAAYAASPSQNLSSTRFPMYQNLSQKGPCRPTRVQLLSIMYRRSVNDFLDTVLTPQNVQSLSLDALDTQLTSGLVQVISSLQEKCLKILNVASMTMYGGVAWIQWQLAKTNYLLPRLARLGVLSQIREGDDVSDVFRDTMPQWLKPTPAQKTMQYVVSEYNCGIDFLPWPDVRNALVIQQDSVCFDDFILNVLQRWVPTGADEDRLIYLTSESPDIWYQFHSKSEREFRDLFYGYLGSWKITKVPGTQQTPASEHINRLVEKYLDTR